MMTMLIGSWEARMMASIVSSVSEMAPSVTMRSTEYCRPSKGNDCTILKKVMRNRFRRGNGAISDDKKHGVLPTVEGKRLRDPG